MPSRLLSQLPPPPPPHHHRDSHRNNLIAPITAAGASFSLFILIAFLYRKLTLSRTAPAPLSTPECSPSSEKHLRRFRFSQLRKSTSSFSTSNRLGQGGFGSVYRATGPTGGEVFAVKVMDVEGSIQGEREFCNEIALANRVIAATAGVGCPYLVKVVGYSMSERRRRGGGGGEGGGRKVVVYELMCNGSLQEKLLDRKCVELCAWERRLKIVVDVAKALRFLHFDCGESGVVHGDVKPSNVLLDERFNAKLGDFGLAKILDDEFDEKNDDVRVLVEVGSNDDNVGGGGGNNEVGSIVEEESVVTAVGVSGSPSDGFERASSVAESWGKKMSVESGKKKGWGSGRDYWWWKQGGEDSSSGRVKDYVMEWIGSEINKERPKSSDLIGSSNDCNEVGEKSGGGGVKVEKKRKKKRFEWWWGSLDEEEKARKKSRKPREWWREEFCEELSKKSTKLKSKSSVGSEMWWQRDEDFVAPQRNKRRKSKNSFGSIDWWLDGFSGSRDLGDVPKSGGISSTPSMRGTVCYIAPEYGGGAHLSQKCDVYSFGVLLLVVISGRRPLQVLASPMSEFERANLVSWARQLAHNAKLLDLVDTSIQSLDKEQAMLCITIALLCLQRSPSKRPNMKEIVEMLTGEAEPPHLPFEFSPSPPSGFPFKCRKKGR
ncbi:hypothetical protein vseg_009282 [Gypsophila vaccaria]